MLDKNGPKTDWTDHLNEDNTAALRAVNSASTYVYKTRSNEQLFKLGFTDQLSESEDSGKIIDLLISDGVSIKAVPVFLDKKVFPNPFMKYKKLLASDEKLSSEPLKPSLGDAQTKTNADCQTEIKLTESPALSDLAKEPPPDPPAKELAAPMALPLEVAVDVKFDATQPASPPLTEEPPPIVAPPPPVPKVVDPRTPILADTYYMHEMKLSVDDDPAIDAGLAKQFKTHIVQLHQNLQEVLEAQSSEKPIAPPKDPCLTQVIDKSKLLLVLDIDETLVHVIRSHEKLPHQHNLKLQRQGYPSIDIKFNLRPYAREFLEEMRAVCNVALMTASHKSYSEVMHAFLDPEKQILCGVFNKDHCVNYSRGRSIKDLSIFNYPEERILLVDNFISAFARQRDNGVPILPFYQSTTDGELKKLARFIKKRMVGKEDIRPILRSTFHVSLYHEIKDIRELVGRLQSGFKVSEKA